MGRREGSHKLRGKVSDDLAGETSLHDFEAWVEGKGREA